MSWIRSAVVALCVTAVLGAAAPASAFASGDWAWPVDGGVVTAYGARYTSGSGTSCTHGGVDLAACAGTVVRACSAGEVVFSGQVPAGEGERTWAVTVLTGDGLRVTYLPLNRSSVTKGTDVAPGTSLGELAGGGDASSPLAHLHLGVRRGEVHLDPMSLLGERVTSPPTEPAAPPAVTASRPARGADPAPSRSAPPVTHAAPAPSAAHAPVAAPAAPRTLQNPAMLPHASLAELPVLRQMTLAANAPRVRTAAVAADVVSARDFLAAMLVRLGLAGVAGCCAWPVLRRELEGHAGRVPAAVAVRRDGA